MFEFGNVEWCFENAEIVKKKNPIILFLPTAYILPPDL